MKTLKKNARRASIAAFMVVPISAMAFSNSSFAAIPGVNTPIGMDSARGCVYNGFKYEPLSGTSIAGGPHCYTTPDNSTVPKVAPVDDTKTAEDLKKVQMISALNPDTYLAKDTFATRELGDVASVDNSDRIASFVANDLAPIFLPNRFAPWLRTGSNIGGGVGAHDNIPIYVVDSSNPHQEFQKFNSTDSRVTSFAKLTEMTTGDIPLPSWAKPSDGGDRALAIYDVATGIFRGYFHAVKDANGVYKFSSAGYWYGDAKNGVAGPDNYWLGYIQGTSSVIGISNELTQIGIDEVKAGEINHVVSVTFPNYQSGKISFPAKLSDGSLNPDQYPNAPVAGQMFTFPKDFDIDAYAAENRIDDTTKAIMKAVQKYGGIISDKNHWCMAFNFENPYGMGVRADNPNANPWRDDPVAAQKIKAMNINKFPWAKTAWLPQSYAATTAASAVNPKPTAPETPDPTAPETPDPTVPETPKPTAPETPKPTAPETPDPTAPETPDPTAPETPKPTALGKSSSSTPTQETVQQPINPESTNKILLPHTGSSGNTHPALVSLGVLLSMIGLGGIVLAFRRHKKESK